MNLDPTAISLTKNGEKVEAVVAGQTHTVDRLARAFPRSNPDEFVSLMDPEGHEIGIIENPQQLDDASRDLLESELKAIYFIPTIKKIRSVTPKGTGSFWEIDTDDGEYAFRISGRDALKGDEPPAIEINDENGKRYQIESYWELDPESRDLIADLLPDKILKARYYTRSMGGSSRGSKGSGRSRGSSSGGSMMGMRR